MNRAYSDFGFNLMAFIFKFRDLFRPRMVILKEVGIKAGDCVLDYGCGPGGYIIPLAVLVGKEGRIYAVDLHPLAIQMVQGIASKKQLTNVKTIHSDCKTGLPDSSIDAILLYDVLHDLSNPDEVLEELRRLLKPTGVLSVSDHHMKEEGITSAVTGRTLFRLLRKGRRTYTFSKEGQ